MNLPADLTDQRGRDWARRIPTLVLSVGAAIVGLLGILASWGQPAGYADDIAEATSWGTMLACIPAGAAIAAVLLGWFVPRLGAWTVAVAVTPWFYGESPLWFSVVAWAWAGVVALDLALVVRQRSVSHWMSVRAPSQTRWQADHHLGARLMAALLLAAAVATGLLLWHGWRDDARALAERAVPVETEVTAVDTVFDSVFVKLDGAEREFFVDDAHDHPVGSTFVVFTDPTGQMAPYGAEDVDPSDWSIIGLPLGAGLLLLWVVVVELGRRRRRVEALATGGGASMRALIGRHPLDGGFVVFAVDDAAGTRPLAYLPKIEQLVPRTGSEPTGVRGGIEDARGIVRRLFGAPTRARRGGAYGRFRDEARFASDDPFADDRLVAASIVGLVSDGSLCVLEVPDGDEQLMLGAVRPARDTVIAKTLIAKTLSHLPPRSAGYRAAETGVERTSPIAQLGLVLLHRSARFGWVALAAAGFVVVPWLQDSGAAPFVTLEAGAVIAVVSMAWWVVGRPRVTTSRWGLRLSRIWHDRLVLAADGPTVRRSGQKVVLELPGLTRVFRPRRFLSERDQSSELDQIAAAVEGLAQRDQLGQLAHWAPGRLRWLPSSGTLVGLVALACWLVPALAAK